jgi:hypothetical protein
LGLIASSNIDLLASLSTLRKTLPFYLLQKMVSHLYDTWVKYLKVLRERRSRCLTVDRSLSGYLSAMHLCNACMYLMMMMQVSAFARKC